jgi:hypothetical protein
MPAHASGYEASFVPCNLHASRSLIRHAGNRSHLAGGRGRSPSADRLLGIAQTRITAPRGSSAPRSARSRWWTLFSRPPVVIRRCKLQPLGLRSLLWAGPAMARGDDTENAPTLICEKCRRPMEFLALLPAIANLPAAYAYRCMHCLRVETIVLK